MVGFFDLCFASLDYNGRDKHPLHTFELLKSVLDAGANGQPHAFIIMGFKELQNKRDVALALGIEYRELTYILYGRKVENLYISFDISKKNGGIRTINAPIEPLKAVQRTIADELYLVQKKHYLENGSYNSNIVHGFVKGKGIISNAAIHRNKKYVLNIDLENFFDSFHFGRVKGYFEKNRYFKMAPEAALCLAQLTCYQGKLPQGAPSSPIITNLICAILDRRIALIARKYRLHYTRYADDITFSTNDENFIEKQEMFFVELRKEIENAGFKINECKSRFCRKSVRQEVTGLVVNNKINVKREFYKTTRSMAHNLYCGKDISVNGTPATINTLEGRLGFINQLDKYQNTKNNQNKNIYKLNSREKQYQSFLFYKYFYANTKPLIVTEGKTDIAYIKSALKKMYLDYPHLIRKKKDGSFEFMISFLQRSKRIRFLLGISLDGADAMKNIYNYYVGKNNLPNYWDKFQSLSKKSPRFPVLLVFDNEQITDRPLKQFKKYIGKKENIGPPYWCQIHDNLYLVTCPLVKGDECEIEDLFPKEVLSHKIGGKEFDRNSSDNTKFYGKAVFSMYIASNYMSIDYSQFKDFLTAIDGAVEDYKRNSEK